MIITISLQSGVYILRQTRQTDTPSFWHGEFCFCW